MTIAEKLIPDVNLSFLICSLYTICETEEIFKKLNLKKSVYFYLYINENFAIDLDSLQNTYKILNRVSVRRYSYFLIKPFLNLKKSSKNSTIKKTSQNKENYTSTVFLKKYLRKFKYNYNRYFIRQNSTYENLPTNKEINESAIKLLFIFAGI